MDEGRIYLTSEEKNKTFKKECYILQKKGNIEKFSITNERKYFKENNCQ